MWYSYLRYAFLILGVFADAFFYNRETVIRKLIANG